MAVFKNSSLIATNMIDFTFFHDYHTGQNFIDDANRVDDGVSYQDVYEYVAFYDKAEWHITLMGSGFVMEDGQLVAGTVEAIAQDDTTRDFRHFSIAGLTLDAASLYDALVSDFPYDENLLIQPSFSGDDTFIVTGYGGSASAGDGNDILIGSRKGNLLMGEAGEDALTGGRGQDRLEGGTQADDFIYRSLIESSGKNRDVFLDFSSAEGDRIVLTDMDANAGRKGNQAFTFIGTEAFSGRAGELRFADGNLTADTDGDRVADFRIILSGVTQMADTDFAL